MRSQFPDHLDILCRKGIYPYEWMDNELKFEHQGLPPQKDFYSSLTQISI